MRDNFVISELCDYRPTIHVIYHCHNHLRPRLIDFVLDTRVLAAFAPLLYSTPHQNLQVGPRPCFLRPAQRRLQLQICPLPHAQRHLRRALQYFLLNLIRYYYFVESPSRIVVRLLLGLLLTPGHPYHFVSITDVYYIMAVFLSCLQFLVVA